ncbi:NfeD family protein [Chloroflexota bacterium]
MILDKREKKPARVWPTVMAALLDDIVILAIVLLALWLFKVKYTPLNITIITLLFGGRVYMTYRAVKHSIHRKKIIGPEAMIGLECKVIEPLTPFGMVRFEAEYWKAKSVDEDIDIDEVVEILEINKLVLNVTRKKATVD